MRLATSPVLPGSCTQPLGVASGSRLCAVPASSSSSEVSGRLVEHQTCKATDKAGLAGIISTVPKAPDTLCSFLKDSSGKCSHY